jgi:methyl-accepting chemotaxis protein
MKLSTGLTLTAIGVCSLLIGSFSYLSYRQMSQMQQLAEIKELKLKYQIVLEHILEQAKKAEAFSALIANMPPIQEAFAKRERKTLLKWLENAFTTMKQKYEVKYLHFHVVGVVTKGQTAGKHSTAISFLRVHDPHKHDDDLSGFRKTIVMTNTTEKPQRGFEKGIHGIAIRGMVPVYYQQQHIGSVEFAMKFDQEILKNKYDVGVAFYISHETTDTGQTHLDEMTVTDTHFHPYVRTFEVPTQLQQQLYLFTYEELKQILMQETSDIAYKTLNEQPVAVYSETIKDFAGKNIAIMSIIVNRTDYLNTLYDTQKLIILLAIKSLIIISLIFFWLSKKIEKPITQISITMRKIAQGDLESPISLTHHTTEIRTMQQAAIEMSTTIKQVIEEIQQTVEATRQGEINKRVDTTNLTGFMKTLAETTNEAVTTTATLHQLTQQNAQQDWIKTGQMQLSEKMTGNQTVVELAQQTITFLTHYLNAQMGLFYLFEPQPKPVLKLIASYAFNQRKKLSQQFEIGQGITGQAALEQQMIILEQVPPNYFHIHSGIGEALPQMIIAIPFLFEGTLKGVIEIAALQTFNQTQQKFLHRVMPTIAFAINMAQVRVKIQDLHE